MQFPRMQDLNLAGKRILIRTDFNTPINDGKIINNKRIVAAIPTIKMAVEKGALIALVSHLGRPTTKKHNQEFSLQPAADHLKTLLDQNVRLEKEWIDGRQVTIEMLTAIKRAGADIILSYHAKEIARWIATG